MNIERANMKIDLSNFRQREKELMRQIEDVATVVRANLNTARTPVADLKISETNGLMDELNQAWAELQVTISRIARLEQELD